MNKLLIAILIILIFLVIYHYIQNYQGGKSVKLLENKYLPDISSKIRDYKVSDRCFNPGIFKYQSEIYYVYRIHIGGDFFYGTRLKSEVLGKYPSKNVIYHPKTGKHWLVDTSKFIAVKGFEDPRAVVLGNKLYLIVNEMNMTTRFREMYFIEINLTDLSESKDMIIPKRIIKLRYDKAEPRDQKNWIPMIRGDNLYFIYSLNPYILLSCDLQDGKCSEIMNIINLIPRGMRGSSNMIQIEMPRFGEVYLGITHSRYGYAYLHRFFILRYSDFGILGVSADFLIAENELLLVDSRTLTCFKLTGMIQRRIQFIAGLLQTENILYITYGEDDYYAKQFKIRVSEVAEMLERII